MAVTQIHRPTGCRLLNASPIRLAGGTAGGSVELSVIPLQIGLPSPALPEKFRITISHTLRRALRSSCKNIPFQWQIVYKEHVSANTAHSKKKWLYRSETTKQIFFVDDCASATPFSQQRKQRSKKISKKTWKNIPAPALIIIQWQFVYLLHSHRRRSGWTFGGTHGERRR